MDSIGMLIRFLYLLLMLRIAEFVSRYRVSDIVWYQGGMFAVYYDEYGDSLQFVRLSCTVVHETDEALIYRPILEEPEKVNPKWIFLETTSEVRPMSYYSDVILEKLVNKVRTSVGGC